MSKKIIFSLLFLLSLKGIGLAGFNNWLILSFVIHVTWLTFTSNSVLQLGHFKNKGVIIFMVFNKILMFLLVADMVIIFLSMSFFFRLIFAKIYKLIFLLSFVGIIISLIGNYFIIINFLNYKVIDIKKRVLLFLSSLFYIVGIWTFNTELINRKTPQNK